MGGVHVGIADHLGWAVAVTASSDHEVVDRRRIALVEPGVSPAPLRAWPLDFPADIAVQRRAPWEARAGAVMYRQELSELAHARGWEVHVYDAKAVVGQAISRLGGRADEVLHGPRARLGPPWTRDHRLALAATVIAAAAAVRVR